MHMADALISPLVGGAMLLTSGGIASRSIKKIQDEMDEKKIPLMGVMGAFIFAAQMINFTIPGTGSSGHLGGGMLLAILLGPYAGFLTMASILLIQALFFGDGGLMAYGCNVFNLGFYTCFVAYPLIYKPLIRRGVTSKRIIIGAMLSAVIGLQLGAFSVVLETLLSGKTELPFEAFVLLMQPLHLGIGLIEGLVTATVVTFLWKARPELLIKTATGESLKNISLKKILAILAVAAVIVGGGISLLASENPDGLEWSIQKISGDSELTAQGGIYTFFEKIQQQTAILPDYGYKTDATTSATTQSPQTTPKSIDGTSFSGIIGGLLTLALAVFVGGGVRLIKRKQASNVKGD